MIILLTDGDEYCDGRDSPDAAIAAAQALSDGFLDADDHLRQIPTYVINFLGGSVGDSDLIAAAGGTEESLFANNETELAAGLANIIAGAIKLAAHGNWGIAGIILVASVLIPLAKFTVLAGLALSVRNGSALRPGRRFLMYEIVEYIGRWSMIDVFVVAILSSLVQLNVVASINPGPAAATFALSVVFTMLSAQAFGTEGILCSLT